MHDHPNQSKCAAGCSVSRRGFLAGTATAAGTLLLNSCTSSESRLLWAPGDAGFQKVRSMGPAAAFTPRLRACFVRRKGDYGMRWPGQIYDGEAARTTYEQQIRSAAADLRIDLNLRSEPLYSLAEAEAWVTEAATGGADGLLVVVLDRQEHAWPSARKAADSQIPTVVFSPLGTAFTTNTAAWAGRKGTCVCATDDFGQVRYGMKMMAAGARMKHTRCLVIAGQENRSTTLPDLGIELRYIPAAAFLQMYRQTPENEEVHALANDLIRRSRGLHGPTRQDVMNGIKSYVVARTLLERESADAISMDCLGALGKSDVSLPCIAWAKMNDDGIPAACEADVGAIATHVMVQYLFDRPGFQQDPVPDTLEEAVIGAHCSCPTRLNGFASRPESYDIVPHHGKRDATARPTWKLGQRVTCTDVLVGKNAGETQVVIAAGTVTENMSVPPAGGCVVSVKVKFDGGTDVLAFPGFHQLFFYGDYKKELRQFCQLQGLEAVLA